MKGATKETAGKIVGNPSLQAKGNIEKNLGKVQAKVGNLPASMRGATASNSTYLLRTTTILDTYIHGSCDRLAQFNIPQAKSLFTTTVTGESHELDTLGTIR